MSYRDAFEHRADLQALMVIQVLTHPVCGLDELAAYRQKEEERANGEQWDEICARHIGRLV